MINKDKLLKAVKKILKKDNIGLYYPNKKEVELIDSRSIIKGKTEFAITIPNGDPMFDDFKTFNETNKKMDSILKTMGYSRTASFSEDDIHYRYYGTYL